MKKLYIIAVLAMNAVVAVSAMEMDDVVFRPGINVKDRFGETALNKMILGTLHNSRAEQIQMINSRAEQIQMIKTAIENGADVNLKNDGDDAPLHYAIDKNDEEIARILINAGADVELVDSTGDVPLSLAIMKNNREMVRLLVNNKANINAVSSNIFGWTPLNYALKEGDTQVINFLTQHGAKITEEKDDDIDYFSD